MGNVVANIAKGRVNSYAALPAANDAIILVLLKASGLESDATLIDYDTLAAVLAAANDEADFTGYARATLGSVTVTVDDSDNANRSDAADPSAYTNSGGASQNIGKAVICYDGDTTGGDDTNVVPLVYLDCVVTFDVGVPTTLTFHADGWFEAV